MTASPSYQQLAEALLKIQKICLTHRIVSAGREPLADMLCRDVLRHCDTAVARFVRDEHGNPMDVSEAGDDPLTRPRRAP